MAVWQRRTVVLGSLTLCAMGLSACQTTGTPETNAAPGVVQNSSQAAALGAAPHQTQIKSLSGLPKQATRPNQPMVIGVAF